MKNVMHLVSVHWSLPYIFHLYQNLSWFVICKFLRAMSNCLFFSIFDFAKILMHISIVFSWCSFCRLSTDTESTPCFWASLKCCVDMAASAPRKKHWNFLGVRYLGVGVVPAAAWGMPQPPSSFLLLGDNESMCCGVLPLLRHQGNFQQYLCMVLSGTALFSSQTTSKYDWLD